MKRFLWILGIVGLIIIVFLAVFFNRKDNMATYGSDFLTGGTASARSYFDEAFEPAKACDDSNITKWLEGSQPVNGWWKYDLGASVSKRANKLTLLWQAGEGPTYIKEFWLYGSNDDSDWTEVFTDTMVTNPESWEFTNTTAYRYYKIVLGENDNPGHWYNIMEISLYEDSEQGGATGDSLTLTNANQGVTIQ